METSKEIEAKTQSGEAMASHNEEQDAMEVLTDLSRKVTISGTVDAGDNAAGDDKVDGRKGQKPAARTGSHKEKEDGEECSELNRINSGKSDVPEQTVEVPSATYKCNCGACFEKSSELAAHKRWTCPLVEKRFQCDICKSWFAHEHGLRRHMRHSHKGDYNCSHCDLKFHNRIKLTRHWMEVHYDDRKGDKLKCFFCGDDSFESKFDLESHLLIHKYNRCQDKKKLAMSKISPEIKYVDLTELSDEDTFTILHSLNNSKPYSRSDPGLSTTMASPSGSCHVSSTSGVENLSAPSHHHRFTHHHRLHPPHHPHHHLHPPPHHPHHHLHPPPHHPPQPNSPHHHPPPSSNQQQYPPPPHVNSQFDPSLYPPFFFSNRRHQFGCWRGRGRGRHQRNRWKWKQCFNDKMCRPFSPTWPYAYPESHMANQHQTVNLQTSEKLSNFESPGFSVSSAASSPTVFSTPEPSEVGSEETSNSFKMVCKFCDQVIEKGRAAQHRQEECPYICVFKCDICGRVFRKHQKLIYHMYKHSTNQTEARLNSMVSSFNDSLSVSNLQRQLNSVLNSQKPASSSGNSEVSISKDNIQNLPSSMLLLNRTPNTSRDYHSEVGTSADIPTFASVKDTVIQKASVLSNQKSPALAKINELDDDSDMEEESLVIDDVGVNTCGEPSILLQCSVCHTQFESTSMLSLHLQSHITHVTAVQKVHEWKERSIQYFSDSGNTKGNSSVLSDGLSTTTSEVSFQDTGSLSISEPLSTPSTTVGSFSLITNTLTESEKWLKPHCKKKKKKMKDWKDAFSCEHCDETFSSKKEYSCHMKEKHPEIKHKLECPVCQKKFSWKKRGHFYERHLSSHYGVSVFKHKCDICEKTFLEKCKFRAHMAVHHSKAEELLHTCHLCGKTYGTKSSLTRHLRHHTGDKPHQCSVCQKSFLEKRELTRHMASHTGQPAFECIHCGQGFTLKTSLDTHMKRKHSNPPPQS